MVTSIVYTEKKYKTFTFVLTIGGFFLSVVGGYFWGLCDANTLLLTKNTLMEKTQKEQEGMQMAELLKKCESASEELVTMVGDVEENLENSRRANEQIVSSARDTSADCDESRNQVERIQESVSEMSEAIDGIVLCKGKRHC